MAKMMCENCCWFDPDGICRVNPPTLHDAYHNGELIAEPGRGVWPRVSREDWCSSYEEDRARMTARYTNAAKGK